MISTAEPDFEPVWCGQCLSVLSIGEAEEDDFKYYCQNCGVIEMWELEKQFHPQDEPLSTLGVKRNPVKI